MHAGAVATWRRPLLPWDVPIDHVRPGELHGKECAIVHLRSFVTSQPLSLAQACDMLIVRHGRPVVGCVVLWPVASCVRTEKVRCDIDHSGGLTVKRRAVVVLEGGRCWDVRRVREHSKTRLAEHNGYQGQATLE
jgi:hypothetical protein